VACALFDGLEAIKFTGHTKHEPLAGRTADGRIWFPNPQGLALIDPTHIFTNSVLPRIVIQQIRINGAEITNRVVPKLQAGEGRLEFSFAVLSYIAHQKARVRYKLEGYDNDWVDAEGRRSAQYNNLKPGTYSFQVQGCNGDGVWNSAGDQFTVELPPAFYQTYIFMAMCILLGWCLLALIYRWLLSRAESRQRKLKEANDLLEAKVRERTAELESTHQQLMVASRMAGMAEVATGVLHNVGNVLNSVNVSASVLSDTVRNSQSSNLAKVVDLLDKHQTNLVGFLTEDEKGRQVCPFLSKLSNRLTTERSTLLSELESLSGNIEHIKEIVAMQQANANRFGVVEAAQPAELMESAVRMNEVAYSRHRVELVREFEEVPTLYIDKHKVLQVLINLLQNAKRACSQSRQKKRQVTLRIRRHGDEAIRIEVADNGVGIPPENLTRIFAHGFTTHADGHGYGLHNGALTAKQLGGTLTAHSDGPEKGATFILELPVKNGVSAERRASAGGVAPVVLGADEGGRNKNDAPVEHN
jgi:signal transduction histidine kinase